MLLPYGHNATEVIFTPLLNHVGCFLKFYEQSNNPRIKYELL